MDFIGEIIQAWPVLLFWTAVYFGAGWLGRHDIQDYLKVCLVFAVLCAIVGVMVAQLREAADNARLYYY